MPQVRVNGVDLFYHVEGEGRVVVFCHGVGGNHLSWWQQVPHFARHFRCVTFDHRGFALSPNTEEGVGAEAFSTDLAKLLDHLAIDEPVFLVGQSMGGRTVVNFTKRFPERVRAIVMCGSVGNVRTPELDRIRKEVSSALPADRLHVAMAHRVLEEQPHLLYLFKLIRMRNPTRPKKFLWRDNSPGTTPEELARFKVPALFLVGEEDRIAPPHMVEAAYRHFPNARLQRVPDTGHSIYFEQPELFNRTLMEFFREAM